MRYPYWRSHDEPPWMIDQTAIWARHRAHLFKVRHWDWRRGVEASTFTFVPGSDPHATSCQATVKLG